MKSLHLQTARSPSFRMFMYMFMTSVLHNSPSTSGLNDLSFMRWGGGGGGVWYPVYMMVIELASVLTDGQGIVIHFP